MIQTVDSSSFFEKNVYTITPQLYRISKRMEISATFCRIGCFLTVEHSAAERHVGDTSMFAFRKRLKPIYLVSLSPILL